MPFRVRAARDVVGHHLLGHELADLLEVGRRRQVLGELAGYNLFDGFLSGPVPGTSNKLRFMVSGRQQRAADQVLEFDNQVADPDQAPTDNVDSVRLHDRPTWAAPAQ